MNFGFLRVCVDDGKFLKDGLCGILGGVGGGLWGFFMGLGLGVRGGIGG